MPVYEYKREDGTTFEKLQSMDDEPLTECPETGQRCKRIITGGIQTVFVGDKWPDKQARKERKKRSAFETTLPEYEKKIQKNSEKAREMKAKNN